MYQTSQMEPILFWMLLANPFRSLIGMNDVRNVHIGIAFIDEIIQQIQSIQDAKFCMVEIQPFCMLNYKIGILVSDICYTSIS